MNCSHATLGKNIRTLRNARGLSQEALAQDAQITMIGISFCFPRMIMKHHYS